MVDRDELTDESWMDVVYIEKGIVPPFDELWTAHPVEFGKVRIHGREIPTPRWQQSYLRDYTFTGMSHSCLDMPNEIEPLLYYVNELGYAEFNQILINWYEDGFHYIGPHSDNTVPLLPNSPIITVSFGEARKFRIRDKKSKAIVRDIMTEDHVALVMGGAFQKEFTHEIVKVAGNKGKDLGRRISITFRQFSD